MKLQFVYKLLGWSLGLTLLCGCPAVPDVMQRTLNVSGVDRTFSFYVPTTYDPNRATPLVLLLHGTGYDGAAYIRGDGWIAKSESVGCIVVAPNALGIDRTQPATLLGNPSFWDFGASNPDQSTDSQFIDATFADIRSQFNIDARRIFVAGHSGGGAMASILVQRNSDLYAAAAVLSSPLIGISQSGSVSVPTLYIQGTADPIVPIDGGDQFLGAIVPPLEQSLANWARILGCTGTRSITSNVDGVERSSFSGCPAGSPFEIILVAGMGHRWPGGAAPDAPEVVLGPFSNALNGTDAVWSFFEAHPN